MALTPAEQAELQQLEAELGGGITPAEQVELQQLEQEALAGAISAGNTGTRETLGTQALQGATFGFGDELGALGATLALKPAAEVAQFLGVDIGTGDIKDRSFGEVFDEALMQGRSNIERQLQERPLTSLAGMALGGIGTGVAGAGTQAGKALQQAVTSGPVAARIAKGAGVGAASGGAFGFGQGEGGGEERLSNAGEGALTGGIAGGAIPAGASAGKAIYNTVEDAVGGVGRSLGILAEKGVVKTPQQASQAVKELASDAYATATEKGGVLSPKFATKFVNTTKKILPRTKEGELIAGKESQVNQLIDRVNELSGRRITLDAAQDIDEQFGKLINKNVDAVTGNVNADGRDIIRMQDEFRKLIENASPGDIVGGDEGFKALKEARKLWSASRRLDDVERIVERAQLTDNPSTAIKTGFRTLFSNKKRLAGFSDQEKELIKKAAQSGAMQDAMRVVGSRLNPIISLGSGAGVPSAAALQGAGMAARDAATRLQFKRAEEVAEQILRGVGQLPQQAQRANPALPPLEIGAGALSNLSTEN